MDIDWEEIEKNSKLPRSKRITWSELGKKYNLDGEILRGRWRIHKKKKEYSGLAKECKEQGIPFESVRMAWAKTDGYSIMFKNEQDEPLSYFDIKDDLISEMQQYAPKYPKIKYPKHKNGHCFVVDPADIHLGKLCDAFETGDTYNNEIVIQRVKEGVLGLIEKAKGFNIDEVVLIVGNDIMHTDTPRRTTTSGTPQDTDGMWYSNFKLAKELYIWTIETLIQVGKLKVIFNPSNHDWMTGFFLIDSIYSWFKNAQIEWDIDMQHRKYHVYGNSLIGTSHGDGAKMANLPLLMATESKDWSSAKFRYIYMHHLHHKHSKEQIGVTIEGLRSPSGTDGWHHRNGYIATKAVEAFIHSKENGQVCRLTHYF